MEELILGAAYYAEYMPYDRVETDLLMMKKAGLNTIRIAESTWSTLEPVEGEFSFEHIDQVLSVAEKAGMQVIIGTPTYAVPSWLVRIEPGVIADTRDGTPFYGRRQIMDITNPVYLFHAERAIRALMEHCCNHKCVIGFQIDNETKHYGSAGVHMQELFTDYLKDKFVTTDAFNTAFGLTYWSNSIHRWEDMPDMRGCVNGGLAGEFGMFQRKKAAEFLNWQASIVREYKTKDQFITHNLDFEWKKFGADIAQDGYSYGIQPGIDHSEAAANLTLVGTDIYHPTQDYLTGAEIAFCGDEIRSLQRSSYLVLECQAQAFKYWTPYPGQLRLHAYSHLASGAQGLMYWNWHSIHNGYETYWKGILSHDLEENAPYQEIAEFGHEWKELGKERLAMTKCNKIAVIADNHSMQAFEWFPIDRDFSYNDVLRRICDSLYEMNLECDIVHLNQLDTDQYALIIAPVLYSVNELDIMKLKTFVQRGGTLFATFRSFVADRHLSVYHDRLPHLMTDCFGISYQQYTHADRLYVGNSPAEWWAELLIPETADTVEQYEHRYWGNYAAVTRNQFGEGTAFYLGYIPVKEKMKEYLAAAAQTAGVNTIETEVKWPVIIKSGVSEAGRKLHYILHYSQEEDALICVWDKTIDLLTGKTYEKGDKIRLRDWDVVILEEEKESNCKQ